MALNVVEIWRDLHKTPELGFEEEKTSAYLAEALEKLGYAVTRGVGKTGVMGVIRGAEPGPVLMLRADMDALPFRNDDGSIEAVHACGHDSHCAMVLAAASELADRVRRGTLKILFQPGEETLHGALEVLKSGAVDDVDIALGCHVRPIQDIPTGTCAAAVRHTSSTFADIVIHGRTAHASRPHLGVNCAEVAAAVTQAVAAIKGDPAKVWSCKVTSIQACAAAVNIIPDTATLKLDIRAQTNELMDELLEKVRMAAAGTAAAYGATAEVILPGIVIPAAVYDEDLVAELAGTIREVLGDECLARDCGGGGEDFHFLKKERPQHDLRRNAARHGRQGPHRNRPQARRLTHHPTLITPPRGRPPHGRPRLHFLSSAKTPAARASVKTRDSESLLSTRTGRNHVKSKYFRPRSLDFRQTPCLNLRTFVAGLLGYFLSRPCRRMRRALKNTTGAGKCRNAELRRWASQGSH